MHARPQNAVAEPAHLRQHAVFRPTTDYFLGAAVNLKEAIGGDMVTTLVFFALAKANVAHLNRPVRRHPLTEIGVFPDEVRRPVTVHEVAGNLRLPYETVRRHVGHLIRRGLCVRMGSAGVMVPGEALRSAEVSRAVAAHFRELRRLVRNLKTASPDLPGVAELAPPERPPAGPKPRAA